MLVGQIIAGKKEGTERVDRVDCCRPKQAIIGGNGRELGENENGSIETKCPMLAA
jgi:hypothetical protein